MPKSWIVLDEGLREKQDDWILWRKGDGDEQIGAANDCDDGVAERNDNEYRVLWSVESHEECLSLDQQHER